MVIRYTPTEQKILDILADGRPHSREELKKLLPDGEMNGKKALPGHITNLRKKLNPIGESVLCELHKRQIHYRHVRLISTD